MAALFATSSGPCYFTVTSFDLHVFFFCDVSVFSKEASLRAEQLFCILQNNRLSLSRSPRDSGIPRDIRTSINQTCRS